MKYTIQGVDRESGMDVEWVVEAQTWANAKAKAELQGIVVTSTDPSDANPMDQMAKAARRDEHPGPTPAAARVRTIEQTGKEWKVLQLIGGLLLFLAVPGMCVGFGFLADDDPTPVGGVIFLAAVASFIFGSVLAVIGKIGAWWYHG